MVAKTQKYRIMQKKIYKYFAFFFSYGKRREMFCLNENSNAFFYSVPRKSGLQSVRDSRIKITNPDD